MAGASGPATQWASDAVWGGRACDCLAPAHRRPVAGAAARLAALAHRVWLVSQGDEPGAVRPLAGGCRPPTPPGCGRRAKPRLSIIDTQAVKGIPVRGPGGYDANKKVL